MKKMSWLITLAIVLLTVSAKADEKPFTVFLFGDSLAEGLSSHLANDFKQENIKFISMTKRGTTIRYWSHNSEFKKRIMRVSPDLILISLGTNDMKMSNPLEESIELIDLLKICYLSSNQVFWLLPPKMPFPDYGLLDMVEESRVPTLQPPYLDEYRSKDKVHLNSIGYKEWADYIVDMLLGD